MYVEVNLAGPGAKWRIGRCHPGPPPRRGRGVRRPTARPRPVTRWWRRRGGCSPSTVSRRSRPTRSSRRPGSRAGRCITSSRTRRRCSTRPWRRSRPISPAGWLTRWAPRGSPIRSRPSSTLCGPGWTSALSRRFTASPSSTGRRSWAGPAGGRYASGEAMFGLVEALPGARDRTRPDPSAACPGPVARAHGGGGGRRSRPVRGRSGGPPAGARRRRSRYLIGNLGNLRVREIAQPPQAVIVAYTEGHRRPVRPERRGRQRQRPAPALRRGTHARLALQGKGRGLTGTRDRRRGADRRQGLIQRRPRGPGHRAGAGRRRRPGHIRVVGHAGRGGRLHQHGGRRRPTPSSTTNDCFLFLEHGSATRNSRPPRRSPWHSVSAVHAPDHHHQRRRGRTCGTPP